MNQDENEFGQPVGVPVVGWAGARQVNRDAIVGSRCRLESLDVDVHANALYAAYCRDAEGRNWTYLPYGPFANEKTYRECVAGLLRLEDTDFFAIVNSESNDSVGVSSYLRASPAMGTVEVGHLSYAPVLQRTPASTEAMYLMMRRVFDDWGYRRYEWKCDSLNIPSRAAARRLGFRFEGVFLNHFVVKGRNRDTAWFSITDDEWPAIRSAMESWLEAGNFDDAGRQRKSLAEMMPVTAGRARVVDVAGD